MSNPIVIELFAEDYAHEAFLVPLLHRLVQGEGRTADVRVRSSVGGHGRALAEYRLQQRTLLRGGTPLPDLFTVCIDANCKRYAQARQEILQVTDEALSGRAVIGCPDPHVERWYMDDAASFAAVVGRAPRVRQGKCVRDYYKTALARAVREAGHPAPLNGIEFASEIVAGMDLFRAARNDRSLSAFISSVRSVLRQLR
jgi:hypothetical protein